MLCRLANLDTPELAFRLTAAHFRPASVQSSVGEEDQAMAALLHDAIEDGGKHYAKIIWVQFGAPVTPVISTLCPVLTQSPNAKLMTVPRSMTRPGRLSISSIADCLYFRRTLLSCS